MRGLAAGGGLKHGTRAQIPIEGHAGTANSCRCSRIDEYCVDVLVAIILLQFRSSFARATSGSALK